jgi:hypothetical protein
MDGSRRRNPPLDGNAEAGYGFAYNPPRLDIISIYISGRPFNGSRQSIAKVISNMPTTSHRSSAASTSRLVAT